MVGLVLAFAFIGCGGSATSTSTDDTAQPTTAATTEAEVGYPVPQAPPQKGALHQLVVKNVESGTGPVARWGDEVAVRYVGLVYQTGDVYSQHWKSVAPLDFELDRESFGIGWQKGIEGMRVGGRRELLIPAHLLFEDEDVAYLVALLRVEHEGSFPQEGPFAALRWGSGEGEPKFNPPDRPAPKALVTRDLEIGSGPTAHRGDDVAIYYSGAVYRTGEPRYGGTTQPFRLGSGGLGRAFEEAIEGMEAGGRREAIVPSRLLGGTPAIDYAIRLEMP